ncbi:MULTISPECIES: hypothetical protein [Metallosphaera]|nr:MULTISPECIES: hypothetical protein [Metallosphaera]AKV74216.1 hypothetical protein MsedA_1206 [Metallosphaera sedula]AKV76455.1 hypothetical protein MsedB_1208 [Metallosphaera sedula]MCY0860940.1 hypothetical protein [Metallosphaera prunae]WPX07391.1 hypothetical protein SOJ17_001156 [Metallosphaera sedula DSM 5348]
MKDVVNPIIVVNLSRERVEETNRTDKIYEKDSLSRREESIQILRTIPKFYFFAHININPNFNSSLSFPNPSRLKVSHPRIKIASWKPLALPKLNDSISLPSTTLYRTVHTIFIRDHWEPATVYLNGKVALPQPFKPSVSVLRPLFSTWGYHSQIQLNGSLTQNISQQLKDMPTTQRPMTVSHDPGNPGGDSEELDLLDKFTKLLTGVGSAFSDRWQHIWIYDCDPLKDTLAMIAVELMNVADKRTIPVFVNVSASEMDPLLSYFLLGNEGVYVLEGTVQDQARVGRIKERLRRSFGSGLVYVIASKEFHDEILSMAETGGPNREPMESAREVKSFECNKILNLVRWLTLISSGFSAPPELADLTTGHRLLYSKVLDKADSLLREMEAKIPGLALLDRPNAGEGRESMDHRLLKRLALYDLVSNRGIDVNKVYVEGVGIHGRLSECGELVPDLFVETLGLAIDVKTSYGALPADELSEAVEKYSKCGRVEVVFRPLPALLFLKDIVAKLKAYRETGVKVSVKIPAMTEGRPSLIDLADAFKRLKAMGLVKADS